jgi:molybdopterin-biosynthesis enzyme MoeA-like protein
MLERIVVIPDHVETISGVVRECAKEYDLVFTSGGIGPTHDDMTIEGIARAFDRPVVHHPELRGTIERALGARATTAYLKMAEVPEGATLIDTANDGFPTIVFQNVHVLPGVPEIFEAKVRSLCERFRTEPFHTRQILLSASEANIADHLHATLARYPELLLGSYPKFSDPEYRVRLTLESKDEAYVESALNDLIARLPVECIVRVER